MDSYDRTAEDVGNILAMEHVNLTVPDQTLAASFYVSTLGFTRDPYVDFGTFNMWINAGEQQFHLPTGEPQRFRGVIGLALPDLEALVVRLDRAAGRFAGTAFAWEREGDAVTVTCPWGNRLRCHGAGDAMALGIPYLEIPIGAGAADGVARFYREILMAPATVSGGTADVQVGRNQRLRFRETREAVPPYDGHHIAIYIAAFSAPHRLLAERGLVTEESDAHQYRFQAIVDPASGAPLTELEHEVRSLMHPLHRRHLVNRNPAIGLANYRAGREVFVP